MKKKSLFVKHRGKKRAAAFKVDLPETLEEALDYLGEMRLLKLLCKQIEFQARSASRSLLAYDHSPESVRERMETEWFPLKRLRKVSPIDLRRIPEDGADLI